MSDLYCTRQGTGAPVVLVHGWGLNGAVWGGVAPQLASHAEVFVPDLPGCGRSRAIPQQYSLAQLAHDIDAVLPGPATWIGWSLGGLIALTAAAQFPARVQRLVLIDTTPKFVQGTDWSQAMSEGVMQQFAVNLTQDYQGTLQRFLSLQMGAEASARETLRALRERLFAHGEPDVGALTAGLALLRDSDLRPALRAIAQSVLLVHGERDKLAPVTAAHYLRDQLPQARLHTIPLAGHAPFLSHPQLVLDLLRGFLDE
jgi:pimeloyl-[acyl-carrier protein] methyl ester esterase